MNEIVLNIGHRQEPDVWQCPKCHGLGHRANGSAFISSDRVVIRRPTPCSLCLGKGIVRVTALEEDA